MKLVGAIVFATVGLGITAAILLVMPALPLIGGGGEDSWKHFTSGGMFVTASPSGRSIHENVYFASPSTGHGDIYTLVKAGDSPVRLTTSTDFEASPLFAATGDKVVFSKEEGGLRHIWSMKGDGSKLTQLTFGRVLDDPVQLSTDGRYLLFSRSIVSPFDHGGRVTSDKLLDMESDAGGLQDVGIAAVMSVRRDVVVYTEDLDTLRTLKLSDERDAKMDISAHGMPLQISRDGRYLVTSRPKAGATPYGEREIWLWDFQEQIDTHLDDGWAAIVFGGPEHKAVALKGVDKDLILYDLSDGSQRRLTSSRGFTTMPQVTNDGKGFLLVDFVRSGQSEFRILGMTSADTEPQTITVVK